LEAHEKKKKEYSGLASSNVTFTPFVVSTDSLIGKENLAEEAIHPIG
jgi:hypothetical protein